MLMLLQMWLLLYHVTRATRNGAAPPRRTNTFAETLDAQWLMEQRQRQADRNDERTKKQKKKSKKGKK